MDEKTRAIADVIAKTSPDAARRYIDLAPVRIRIEAEARDGRAEWLKRKEPTHGEAAES